MALVQVDVKSINSKGLYEEIYGFLKEGIDEFGVIWDSEAHRESYVEVVNDFLTDIAESGKIEQFKVVGDKRNNKYTDMDKGIYHVDVMYRQRNCLNTSQINLTIHNFDNDIDEELLDFLGLNP